MSGVMTTVAASRWFDAARVDADAAMRLLAFPHAGAGAIVFNTWKRSLPAWIDVVPIHLPGRGARLNETPFRRVEPLVDAACKAIEPLLDRPVALFGHSVGAAIAFELARRLEDDGRAATHLFVAGRSAPRARRMPDTYHLPDAEFINVLRELNGMPAEMLEDPEALDLLLPILRADFELSETYRDASGPPLRCPIDAFCGLADAWAAPADMQAWQAHTRARFSLRVFRGDHFFVASAQAELLRAIGDALRQQA